MVARFVVRRFRRFYNYQMIHLMQVIHSTKKRVSLINTFKVRLSFSIEIHCVELESPEAGYLGYMGIPNIFTTKSETLYEESNSAANVHLGPKVKSSIINLINCRSVSELERHCKCIDHHCNRKLYEE